MRSVLELQLDVEKNPVHVLGTPAKLPMPENMQLAELEHHPHASFATQVDCEVSVVQGLTMVAVNEMEVEEQLEVDEMQLPDMELVLVVEEYVQNLHPPLDAKHV